MTTPWYLEPITQSFNGGKEKGVDLGVPYHTPINPLFPGVVTAVDTGPYGQEVNVAGVLNGQNVNAAYVHLDQATVAVGQPVTQSSLLGYSGGQLSGGLHPASPAYSSGPHIEFSLWPSNTTPYTGTPYNPMSFIGAVQQSGGAILPALDTSQSVQNVAQPLLASGLFSNIGNAFASLGQNAQNAGNNVPSPANIQAAVSNGVQSGLSGVGASIGSGIQAGIQGGLSGVGSDIGNGIVGGLLTNVQTKLGVKSLPDLLFRAGLLIVALVLIIVIAQALTAKATQNTVETISNSKPVQTLKNVAPFVK